MLLRIGMIEDEDPYFKSFRANFRREYRKLRPTVTLNWRNWHGPDQARFQVEALKNEGAHFDVLICDFWLHEEKNSLAKDKLNDNPIGLDVVDGVMEATALVEGDLVSGLAFISATSKFDGELGEEIIAKLKEKFRPKLGEAVTVKSKSDVDFYPALAAWVSGLQDGNHTR